MWAVVTFAKSQKNLSCSSILPPTRIALGPYTLITVMIDFCYNVIVFLVLSQHCSMVCTRLLTTSVVYFDQMN